jgi:transposase
MDKILVNTSYFGYFTLLSTTKVSTEEAIFIYRQKEVVEKAFHITKSMLSSSRTTLENSIQGVIAHHFIRFVS